MQKKLIQVASIIACAAILLCGSNLFAGMIAVYNDSFETAEGYTLNSSFDGVGDNDWKVATWGASTAVEVRAAVPTDGDNALRFAVSPAYDAGTPGSGDVAIYKTFVDEAITNQIIEVEIDLRARAVSTTGNTNFAIGDSSMTYDSATVGDGVGVMFGYGNYTFQTWNGDSACVGNGVTATAGTYYTFHAIIDLAANLYSVEVIHEGSGTVKIGFDDWSTAGTVVTHDYGDGQVYDAFTFRKSITDIQNILLRGSNISTTGPMYVDSISISAIEVPEPSTVALILVSLLALGFCRKLKK